jgi:hypothetical protein
MIDYQGVISCESEKTHLENYPVDADAAGYVYIGFNDIE